MTIRSICTARLEASCALAIETALGIHTNLRTVIQRSILTFVNIFTGQRLFIVFVPGMTGTIDASSIG